MYCQYCGKVLDDSAVICDACGKSTAVHVTVPMSAVPDSLPDDLETSGPLLMNNKTKLRYLLIAPLMTLVLSFVKIVSVILVRNFISANRPDYYASNEVWDQFNADYYMKEILSSVSIVALMLICILVLPFLLQKDARKQLLTLPLLGLSMFSAFDLLFTIILRLNDIFETNVKNIDLIVDAILAVLLTLLTFWISKRFLASLSRQKQVDWSDRPWKRRLKNWLPALFLLLSLGWVSIRDRIVPSPDPKDYPSSEAFFQALDRAKVLQAIALFTMICALALLMLVLLCVLLRAKDRKQSILLRMSSVYPYAILTFELAIMITVWYYSTYVKYLSGEGGSEIHPSWVTGILLLLCIIAGLVLSAILSSKYLNAVTLPPKAEVSDVPVCVPDSDLEG